MKVVIMGISIPSSIKPLSSDLEYRKNIGKKRYFTRDLQQIIFYFHAISIYLLEQSLYALYICTIQTTFNILIGNRDQI